MMHVILPVSCNDEYSTPASYVLVELTAASIQRLIDMMSHMKTLNESDSPFEGHIDEIHLSESWGWPWFQWFEGLDEALEGALPEGETLHSLGYAIISDEFADKLNSVEPTEEISDAIATIEYPQLVVCGERVSSRIYFSCYWKHTNVVIESCFLYLETLEKLLKEAA
jgi:hypothetical protein